MEPFGEDRPRRRPSLTPMIDVVFLLLVFFMLSARFGSDGAIALVPGLGGTAWQGPPRLVDIASDGVFLNGRPLPDAALAEAVRPLVSNPDDPVVLRARDVTLQRLVEVMSRLREAGLGRLVLLE